MKQIKQLTIGLLLAFVLTGCKTRTPTQNIAFAAALAKSATVMGVGYDLTANPDHRQAYEIAVQSLNLVLRSGNYDSKALAAALANLPVKELKGTQGALIVAGAVSVFELATATFLDIESSAAVFAVATAVRDGLEAALASTPTAPTPAMRSVPLPSPAAPSYKIPTAYRRKI